MSHLERVLDGVYGEGDCAERLLMLSDMTASGERGEADPLMAMFLALEEA